MGKYISNEAFAKMAKAEAARRGSESFFSSKEGDNYFNNVAGQELTVVGLQPVPANGDIKAFNVVIFDDGHQMSTSKFFAAKGLKWPVGGNTAKLAYVATCIESEKPIKVVPKEVKVTPMKRNDGTFVGPRGADGKTTSLPAGKNGEVPATALMNAAYYFEEKELPLIELIDFSEEA